MLVDFDDIRMKVKKKSYHLIGSGSGREVFDLENGYVAKIAKNRRGLAQNKAEKQIASMNHSKLFAKIIAVSEDFIYLIMEKADRINNFSYVLKYFNVKNNRELFRLEEFRDCTIKYRLLLPDLYRRSSWGIINGRPVIIDFGFTKEVRKYYSFF